MSREVRYKHLTCVNEVSGAMQVYIGLPQKVCFIAVRQTPHWPGVILLLNFIGRMFVSCVAWWSSRRMECVRLLFVRWHTLWSRLCFRSWSTQPLRRKAVSFFRTSEVPYRRIVTYRKDRTRHHTYVDSLMMIKFNCSVPGWMHWGRSF